VVAPLYFDFCNSAKGVCGLRIGEARNTQARRLMPECLMPSDAPQPAFVLVRPQMGENIGRRRVRC